MGAAHERLSRPSFIAHCLFIITLAFLVSLAFAGCNQATNSALPPAQDNVVRIASSFPKRGLSAPQGKLVTQAIDLALEQKQSPTATWKIEHIALDASDSESGEPSTEQERQNANLVVDDPSVVAYIGPYTSDATGVSLPITNKAGLLQLGTTATWPGLTMNGWNLGEPEKYYPTGKRNYARLMPPDSAQGAAAAWWASKLLTKRVFVVSDGSSYSDGLATAFISSANKLKLQVVGQAKVGNVQDIPSEVMASGAEMLFYAPSTVEQAVEMATALNDVSQDVKIIVSDTAFKDQFLEQAGDTAAKWRFVFNGVECGSCSFAQSDFVSDFRKSFGEEPTQYAENAYNLATWVVDSVNRGAGRDRAKVIEQILGRTDSQGAIFDEHGDVLGHQMTGYRISNGVFVQDLGLEVP